MKKVPEIPLGKVFARIKKSLMLPQQSADVPGLALVGFVEGWQNAGLIMTCSGSVEFLCNS